MSKKINLKNMSMAGNIDMSDDDIKPSASSQSSHMLSNILTKKRLQHLVKEIDPAEQLDEEVEDMILQLVDEFVTTTVSKSCVFAKHRNSNTLEVKDVQLYLEKAYNLWVPGFRHYSSNSNIYKSIPDTEAHKQRMALIKKVTMKK